ncbi:helix-turn-helix domain-containing protein [Pseudonocardia sp.]|uniref:AraC-like ligand-binding domain-containing protein n=1 Tax=Pseudonocardia sp. TaxID=60912 RepID=UPI0031FC0D21
MTGGHMDGGGQAEELQAMGSAAFAPLRVTPVGPRPFRFEFNGAQASDVGLARIATTSCMVRRTPGLITSSDPELVKITLQTRGRSGIEQGGRQCLLTPGDLSVYTSDRPYELAFTEPYELIVIGVPRAHLGAHADTLQRQSAVRLPTDTGLRHVVGGFFRAMTDTLRAGHAEFSGSTGRHLSDAVTSLIISELVDASTPPSDTEPADQILAYCMTRLSDPSLCVDSVAKAHRISVRYLHKLLQARGLSLAAWIRHQRLQGIRRDLADPALAGRTVASISARWGVLSATHLSRALKAEFGCTAADIRRTMSADPTAG